MSGHTPGPWAVAPNANAGMLLVYSEDTDRHCPTICEVTGREDEREANARAISALPDLVAFAELFKKYLGDVSLDDALLTFAEDGSVLSALQGAARSALAKVRGGA